MLLNIAALVRVYAKNSAGSQEHADQLEKTLIHLQSVGINEVYASVWCDPNQPDSDSGQTCDILRRRFIGNPNLHVIEAAGDLFVDALNVPLRIMQQDGCTHALVLTATASGIITLSVVAAMETAVGCGAQAVAVVHPSFPELVRAGYLTNTHALWNISILLEYGGFDQVDKRPKNFDRRKDYQGVGEAMNVIKFQKHARGPILAIIESREGRGDTRTGEEQKLKIDSKLRRCEEMLGQYGTTWTELSACIMKGYPVTV